MASEPEIIHLDPGSDLARRLDAAGDREIVLEHKGIRFRVNREPQSIVISDYPGQRYDPDRALAGMREAAGSWSDLDADELKEYIYRGREEGSRPIDRP